ncbi:LptF/LptG family permease [Cetobacterium sp. SF1]|uniref:LptF/LptG family permease n=1 Tax=unclassified Cetobacterium TaxID=2630983 RepID=UPI003CEDE643
MKKLDIYISKNFIKSFLLSLIAFVNIFILSQLFKVIKYVSDGRMTPKESIFYIIYLLPDILINVAPLAVLLGSLMAINRMASNLEIISLKTSGISFKRIVIFPVIIAFLISLGVYVLNDKVYPVSLKRSRDIKNGTVKEITVPESKRNAFLRTNDNIVYHMQDINRKTGIANKIEIILLNNKFDKIEQIITAKTGKYNFEKNIWQLKDVSITDTTSTKGKSFKEYENNIYNENPNRFISISVDPDILTNSQLRKAIREIRNTGGDVREYLVTLGKRYSFPFASFIIVFLGLSLGSRYVRGASAISIVLSVGLGYGYYIVQGSFEALSKNGLLNPFLSGWIPNILFLIVGIYFMEKAEY